MKEVFFQYLGVSITTSIFILLLFGLSPVIKERYRVKWRYFIWLFLAFRLLLPVNFGITEPPVEIDIPNIGVSYNSSVREDQRESLPAGETLTLGEVQQLETALQSTSKGELLQETKPSFISLSKILTSLYFAGLGLFLLAQLALYLSFIRATRRWYQPVENSCILAAFEEMKQDLYLASPLRLRLCKKVTSPMITGLIRPTLLLPHENYEGADLTFVLKHELTHFRRKDLWFKLLLLVVQGLHWYNPVVHLMVREANKDIEMACDEEVLKGQPGQVRKQYTERILALMEVKGIQDPPISTSFHGGKHMMRDRIRSIFDEGQKKSGIVTIVFAMFFVILGSACRIQALENLEIPMTDDYVGHYAVDLDRDGVAETTFQVESVDTKPGLFLAARRDWKRLDVESLFPEAYPNGNFGFQAANMEDINTINFLVSRTEAENPFGGRWAFYTWKNGSFQKKSLDPVTENLQAQVLSPAEGELNPLGAHVIARLAGKADFTPENPLVAFYFESEWRDNRKAVNYAPLSDYDAAGYEAWGEEALSKAMIEMKLIKGEDIADFFETPAGGNGVANNDLDETVFLKTTEVLYISLPESIATITSYYALKEGNWVYVTGQIE